MSENGPIEHDLIRTGIAVDFEVSSTKIDPTPAGDDTRVRIELRLPEEDVEVFAFGVIYVLGVLSFHDGRPRGVSGKWFEDDDDWSAADMLRHLEFRHGRLCFYADYVRGRCMKTRIEISSDGSVSLETVNRGEAATRWVDRLLGKRFIAAID